MDFSIYERFADYREGKTTDEREDELSNASLQQLFAEIMTRVEQNGEAFERVLANLAKEHPPLCPHALEFCGDVGAPFSNASSQKNAPFSKKLQKNEKRKKKGIAKRKVLV